MANPNWSATQYRVSLMLAIIDGSAAVQCSTTASKRWYHPDGKLPPYLMLVMFVEVVSQCCMIAFFFTTEPMLFACKTSMWFSFCFAALMSVPLRDQRPCAILLFFASVYFGQSGFVLKAPGLEWVNISMPTKYLVSHLIRHEAYK